VNSLDESLWCRHVNKSIRVLGRFTALRGLYYNLRTATNINLTFTNDLPSINQPFDTFTVARTNDYSEPAKFHRAVSRLNF